jgi:N-acetylmuramic acid 6-phosphate etherase
MGLIKDWDFYWDNRDKFRLGHLMTEKPNPKTSGLAENAQNNIVKAFDSIRNVDLDAINKLKEYESEYKKLLSDFKRVIKNNGRIFISGCGATGRLALMLESLWKQHAPDNLKDKVIGFMAGGDGALVKSVEGFEDHEEYAIRHIQELGFTENDFLIGVTEGGETPFVLSTVEYAKEHSRYNPWMLYCNSDESLANIERSNNLIQADDVESLCLEIESMALTGSTRMQATTVQTLFVGLALFEVFEKIEFLSELDMLSQATKNLDAQQITAFTQYEANVYKANGYTTYETTQDLGLTILTDTTERSPTFSMTAFENTNDLSTEKCLCYVSLQESGSSKDVWFGMLQHTPRTLEWNFSKSDTGIDNLYGFDISSSAANRRHNLSNHHKITVLNTKDGYVVKYGDNKLNIEAKNMSAVTSQVLLKMVLNNHSTVVMGCLGRYDSNIMTYVAPANNKLIDRATRYVEYLLDQNGYQKPDYDDLVQKLYEISKGLVKTDSVVRETYSAVIKEVKHNAN